MRVTAHPADWNIVIQLENDAEEATYVYDLVHSGRLQVEDKERLPLPFRGDFLFKLPDRPRPIPIHTGHVDPTATDVIAGNGGPRIVFSIAKGHPELLVELERRCARCRPRPRRNSSPRRRSARTSSRACGRCRSRRK